MWADLGTRSGIGELFSFSCMVGLGDSSALSLGTLGKSGGWVMAIGTPWRQGLATRAP